jgi:bacillopeptidase F
MAFSRIRRHTEREQKTRLFQGVVGIIAILAFLWLFGVRILVGFSLLVDRIRGGGTPEEMISESIILPPILDPLPEATPSSSLDIRGTGQPGATVILYVNDGEADKTIVTIEGTFTIDDVALLEGTNTVSAKQRDEKDHLSELSNILTVLVKRTPPALELTSPTDNSTVTGDSNIVKVTGKTEEGATLSINGRYAVVRSDGSFNYDYPLNTGDNTLKIVARDNAGNETTIERHVKRE